jgi:hypothetical protein
MPNAGPMHGVFPNLRTIGDEHEQRKRSGHRAAGRAGADLGRQLRWRPRFDFARCQRASLQCAPAAAQAGADAERALAELVGVRTENAAVVRKERAEIETARAAVEKREPAIFVREEEIKAAAEEHRQTRAELDRLRGRFQTVGPGGLVREFVPGHPRGGEDSPRRRTKGVNRT